MTGSDKLMNHPAQRYNTMSPIRTVITTITKKSVNMVAELDYDTAPSRILDTIGQRLEGNSTVAKAATATAVALDTKARAVQGTVVQLKGELAQYQQSRTEAKVLHAIALKTPSDFGADTAAVRMPGRLVGLQVQEQHVRPDKDQLTTDTSDLKMTKDALAEDTTAFEDTTQDWQLQQISRLRRKENCTGWCNESCVRGRGCVLGRGRAACVDVAGIPHRRWQDRMRDKSIQCDYRFLHKVGARSRV